MNRSGNVMLDSLIIIIGLAVVGIGIVMIYSFFSNINTDFQAETDIDADSKALLNDYVNNYPDQHNNLFIFLVIVFWIGAIVSSFMIDSHPIFFIVMMIVLAFLLIIGAFVANLYEDFLTDVDLSAAADKFVPITFIFSHYLETILIIVSSILIALYAKSRID